VELKQYFPEDNRLLQRISSVLEDHNYISLKQARLILQAHKRNKKSTIFRVEFVKRTTGQYRVMRCRFGVTKHLKGGKLAYNPRDYDLLNTWDVDKREYRSINLNDLKKLHINGRSYIVY
jgi:hypothetical protein